MKRFWRWLLNVSLARGWRRLYNLAATRLYGPGYGFCVVHAVDVGENVTAITARDGVPLCRSCARAHDRRQRMVLLP